MTSFKALMMLAVINLVSYALLGWAVWNVFEKSQEDFWLALCLGVLGTACGWLIGFLASPSGVKEETRFSKYSGVIATFASGYFFSKFDPVISRFLDNPAKLENSAIEIKLAVFLSCLISGILIMYIYRSYLTKNRSK